MPYYTKLYRNDELAPRAELVYIYLHDRMDQENKAWPSIHTITKDLSISRSTVKRAIFRKSRIDTQRVALPS